MSAYTVNDGNSGDNYSVSTATSTAGVINKAGLTITAAGNTKTYDGGTTAAATATLTSGSIMSGDTAPAWTESYNNKNAGSGKTLTPASLVVSDGNSGNNYSYTYTPVTTGVINQEPLTITAAGNTKTYDGGATATATGTLTSGSIMSGDTAPAWTESYNNKNAGTGKTLTPAGCGE